jgi:hypothetical protein
MMQTDQVLQRGFNARALAWVMQVDRIFLFRELFVALAMILVISGLALAQTPANRIKGTNSNGSGAAISSSSTGAEARTIIGETKQLGNGTARSWLRVDANGNPTAVGVTFTEEALATVPKEPPPGQEGIAISLALPAEAASTPFKHIGLGWNPHGHEPEKIYDVAHLDFHFYMISEQERNAISIDGDGLARVMKAPAGEFVPQGYIQVPNAAVPKMGSHWINPLSQEFNGQPFSKTFLYGSNNGRLIFAEPMITRAFFEAKTNLTEAINLPAQYQQRGYYPTKYSVRYDAATKEYTVSLEGMTLR